jgi:hypothetical protein
MLLSAHVMHHIAYMRLFPVSLTGRLSSFLASCNLRGLKHAFEY